MNEYTGPGHRPSLVINPQDDPLCTNPPPPDRHLLLAQRWEEGKDIYSGEMLSGEPARLWLSIFLRVSDEAKRADTFRRVRRLVKVAGEDVEYLRDDGQILTVRRTREPRVDRKPKGPKYDVRYGIVGVRPA